MSFKNLRSDWNLYEDVESFRKSTIAELKKTIKHYRRVFYSINILIIISTFFIALLTSITFALYDRRPFWFYYIPVTISEIATFLATIINFSSVRKKLDWSRMSLQKIMLETVKYNGMFEEKYKNENRDFNFFISIMLIMGSQSARSFK